MSKKNLEQNNSSDETFRDRNSDISSKDDVVVNVEISDGNSFKQIVEYFKSTTSVVPLIFYKDRMEIKRGNFEASLINHAVLDNTKFMIKYEVNVDLFNDPDYQRIVKTGTGRLLADGTPEVIEEKVKDPRHIFIPTTDIFLRECKTISRKDGFCFSIFAGVNSNLESKGHSRVTSSDGYMKASKVSANSGPNKATRINGENVQENYREYQFDFSEPIYGRINQKIKLAELCGDCADLVKHKCENVNLMCYPNGFRMKSEDIGSSQDFGWGKYQDIKGLGERKKIVIGGCNSKSHNFSAPQGFIKALSKLQTIAGNASGGVGVVYGHSLATQIILPISIIGELIITILPPEELTEEPEPSDKKECKKETDSQNP